MWLDGRQRAKLKTEVKVTWKDAIVQMPLIKPVIIWAAKLSFHIKERKQNKSVFELNLTGSVTAERYNDT